MTSPLIMRLMALSINVSKRAGAIIRDVAGGNLNIVNKGVDDLQTEADRSAQRCIIASLASAFPKVKIIGEEGGLDLNVPPDWLVSENSDHEFFGISCPLEWRDLKPEDFVIWVDPLDGTSEFTQGLLDHVTILIGVAVKNSAVGGVIHQPYFKNEYGEYGRTIWGLKGLGTAGFQHKFPPKDKLIVTTTRSHMNPIVESALQALSPAEVLKFGGAGYKVLQLLEGNAHCYVYASAGCKKWDTCAPEGVLEAFGGTLTDVLGNHYAYGANEEFPNNRGVLATIDIDHATIVSKMPENVLQKFKGVK